MSKKQKPKNVVIANDEFDRPTIYADDIEMDENGFMNILKLLDESLGNNVHNHFQKRIETKLFQCLKCNEHCIMLIFAPDARENNDMRAYARSLQDHMKKYDVPTWIIGPEINGPTDDEPAYTLKAWPKMGDKVLMIRPSEMNKIIVEHEAMHCRMV